MNAERKTSSPRKLAWQCLCRWGKGGVFAESLIQHAGRELSAPDRSMLQAIVFSCLRHLRLLEHMLSTLRRGKPLEDDARWLLLSGLCQLFVLRWAEYAVVNELVQLSPARLRPVVNGVLRESLRRAEQWQAEVPTLPLGVRFSMPDWIVTRWLTRLGEQECQALLSWLGRPAPVCVRVNALNPPPVLPATWLPIEGAEGWYRIQEGGLPHAALQAGQVYAADPSTRYSVSLLAPQPGEQILDTCAAPGGKSAAILSATGGRCHLLATDALPHRLPTLRENLSRTGASPQSIRVEKHDWTKPCPEAWRGAFDAVLVDVPCSNSGVFQRRVDARWRLSPQEIRKLTRTQLLIAKNAMQAVRPGGRLVYSTCSIEPEENSQIVHELLQLFPGSRLVQEHLALPHHEQADGAYAALLCTAEG